MGKFDGLLLCSDIDGTLIDNDHRVSKENVEAIKYFKSEGGIFTAATGRTPKSAELFINEIQPSIPVICQNGCGIYDFAQNKYLWMLDVDESVEEVVDYVVNKYPFVGFEIITDKNVYFCRENEATKQHMEDEFFPYLTGSFETVPKPWLKILFAQNAEETDILKEEMPKTSYAEKFKMVKSHKFYFEMFNLKANKGEALKRLTQMYNIDMKNVIAIGDNENDIEMLQVAGTPVAVANAFDSVKEHAKIITVDHNNSAIADLVSKL